MSEKTPAEKVEAYRQARETMRKLKEEAKDVGKDFFMSEAKALFDAHPDLIDFGWTQYTPYFNDGDACTFSADTWSLTVNGRNDDYEIDPEEDAGYPEVPEARYGELVKACRAFMKPFEEDELEDWFGDHAEITVTREGVTVDEYEHD